jgi:small subunit ribosomal protein S7
MAKRFRSTERFLQPDPRFGNIVVSKFINSIMRRGKKSIAYDIFYSAMDEIKAKLPDKDPLEVFNEAVNNCKPRLEVRSRRVGGATYQVPVEVNKKRQLSLAMRWILQAARAKKGKPMDRCLSEELIAAFNKEGGAIKTREDTHKMAEANKAFAHLAW